MLTCSNKKTRQKIKTSSFQSLKSPDKVAEREITLAHALMLPIHHMESYANVMDGLLNEYKSKDLLTEDFRTIAMVEIEVKKLYKTMMENYKLNSIKNGTVRMHAFNASTKCFNRRYLVFSI